MMGKQLIVAVEATAAVGPFWQTLISDYLDKMIRSGTLMSTPRMTQPGYRGMQPLGRNNSTEANIPLSQRQTSATLSSAQSNYVKVWEGDLSEQRQGEPVLITRLQRFRIASASKSLLRGERSLIL